MIAFWPTNTCWPRQVWPNLNLGHSSLSVPRSMHRVVLAEVWSRDLEPLIIQSSKGSPSDSATSEPPRPCHSVVANSPLTYCLERPSSSFLPYTQHDCAYLPLCTYAKSSHSSTSHASEHAASSDTSFTFFERRPIPTKKMGLGTAYPRGYITPLASPSAQRHFVGNADAIPDQHIL